MQINGAGTRYELDSPGLDPQCEQGIFSLPKTCPDRHWDTPSLSQGVLGLFPGVKRRERGRTEWSSIYSSVFAFIACYMENFTFIIENCQD